MILVTGATGFLGAELVTQLVSRGLTVRAIKREGSIVPPSLRTLPVEWVTADILDIFSMDDAFAGVEQVYHCAAMISFEPSDRKKLHHVNAEGTANVVNLCLRHAIKKLVHVSSVAAIGEAKPGEQVTEKNAWEYTGKQHGYSISKYEAEMEVWRGIAEGLTAVVVNPSVIIGKHAGLSGSGKIFHSVKNGLKFYPGGSVGIVDVADVACVMILLMESGMSGQRFIVSAGSLSFKELVHRIAEHLGVRPAGMRIYPWMLGIAWRGIRLISLFTGKHYGITKETAYSASKKHEYSSEKLKRLFPDFAFKPITTAIAETCQGLKADS